MNNFSVHPTFLAVDDDTAITSILLHLLPGHFSCKMLIAGNGLEALELLQQYQIDLILSDFEMPKMQGSELFEINRKTKQIPFILMSGRDFKDIGLSNLTLKQFIKKPFTLETLVKAIHDNLTPDRLTGTQVNR